jgi:hypothetical protein
VTRIKWNHGAFDRLRKTGEVQAELVRQAARIASAAGDGFETRPVEVGRHRARAAVVTASFEAMLSEAKHGTLIRAVGGSGTTKDVWR